MVLLVCQVQELLPVQLCISRFGSDSLILLVHPSEVPENKCQIYQAGCPAHNNGDLRRDVSWFVLRLEGLRTYDITGTVTNQVKSSNSRFLRVPSDIAGKQRKERNEGSWGCLCKVVTSKSGVRHREWETDYEEHAQNGYT